MKQLSFRDQDWWQAANGKPTSGRDHRSALRGFDWNRQNETRAQRITPPTDDEIAAELKLRAERDQDKAWTNSGSVLKMLRNPTHTI